MSERRSIRISVPKSRPTVNVWGGLSTGEVSLEVGGENIQDKKGFYSVKNTEKNEESTRHVRIREGGGVQNSGRRNGKPMCGRGKKRWRYQVNLRRKKGQTWSKGKAGAAGANNRRGEGGRRRKRSETANGGENRKM